MLEGERVQAEIRRPPPKSKPATTIRGSPPSGNHLLSTSVRFSFPDYSPLKDTVDDHHLVIVGHDFWIPTVPEEIKPKEEAYYPSKEAIEEKYYTCM
ncbi:hypothetical protein LXL04_036360 [Taraxacum kok-saghyz]